MTIIKNNVVVLINNKSGTIILHMKIICGVLFLKFYSYHRKRLALYLIRAWILIRKCIYKGMNGYL
jgi:hypothetical protein